MGEFLAASVYNAAANFNTPVFSLDLGRGHCRIETNLDSAAIVNAMNLKHMNEARVLRVPRLSVIQSLGKSKVEYT